MILFTSLNANSPLQLSGRARCQRYVHKIFKNILFNLVVIVVVVVVVVGGCFSFYHHRHDADTPVY